MGFTFLDKNLFAIFCYHSCCLDRRMEQVAEQEPFFSSFTWCTSSEEEGKGCPRSWTYLTPWHFVFIYWSKKSESCRFSKFLSLYFCFSIPFNVLYVKKWISHILHRENYPLKSVKYTICTSWGICLRMFQRLTEKQFESHVFSHAALLTSLDIYILGNWINCLEKTTLKTYTAGASSAKFTLIAFFAASGVSNTPYFTIKLSCHNGY